ncbi:MAG: hypothetical protein ACFFFH_09645 [Candidatus Thorarchaeota archaeon]
MSYLISHKLSIKIFWESYVTEEVELRRLILQKGRMESKQHIILKILAFCYFWDRNLVIEPHFRLNRFKPDLIAWRNSEIPTQEKQVPDLWIECKHVKLKKLRKLSRMLPFSRIVWINSKQSLARTLKNIQTKKSMYLCSNVQLIGILTSEANWALLKDSINLKKLHWRVNRHSSDGMEIIVRESDSPISLVFHTLSATIKT